MQTNKDLLICSNCQGQGTISVLGELTSDGTFVVMRFHRGTTKILAEHFTVICGNCDTAAMVRGTYAQ